MNKYQEALNELKELVHSELDGTKMLDKHLEYIDRLQELVDKATPKKAMIKNVCNEVDGDVDYGACPSCEYPLDYSFNYCPKCGEALDWSVEEDELFIL